MLTALAPAIWGTTYLVTTEFLPPDRPLLAAVALSPTHVTFLGLLSPVVATLLGWLVLGQRLTAWQLLGAAIVLAAVVFAQGHGLTRTAANKYQPLTTAHRHTDPEMV